jgi:hypothetical protein
MHDDGNVVPLRKVTTDSVTPSSFARVPVILLQVRDRAALQLRHGLQALFDNADGTLFDMADRACNDVEQNILFEAMRDLRLKRKHIERAFLEHFFEAFVRLTDGTQTALPQILDVEGGTARFGDDHERRVAVAVMVDKALTRDGFALDQLTARLSMLLSKKLLALHNPLGPAMLCEYFMQAGRELGVDIKVKLIILKLFERYVLSDADQLYTEANQLLITTGLLPDLKPAPARRAIDRAAASVRAEPAEAGNAQIDASAQAVFVGLQELLFNVRGSVTPMLDAKAQVQPMSTRELMRLLSHLQQYVPAPAAPDDVDLRHELEQMLTRVNVKSGKSRVVGVADEDVINLIAMLFDCIRDDRNLADSLKALIARLQIPMLKVAVLDKSLFSRSCHPARRLLNDIAAAAMGWGDCDHHERDRLYLRIEHVVQRLLSDFVDDPAIFSELLADFLAFTSDERRRSELLEQRTRDAEEGRAKTEWARQRVEQTLNRVLPGNALPHQVVAFVQEAWSQVLLLTWLKHGDQSAEWQADVQTVEQLVWSVQRHDDPAASLRLLALVPGLLKSLRDGLSRAAFDPFATREFFSALEGLHLQLFERPHQTPTGTSSASTPASVHVQEHIVLRTADERPIEVGSAGLPADDPGLLQVDLLQLGGWVEFQDDKANSLLGKLIAVTEATGRYIFVDRTGMKVLERCRTGLALDFHRGAVRSLDATLLFDRALASVIGNLRRLDRGK